MCPKMGIGTSVSTAVSERTAVIIEDYMFDASTVGELQPEESPSDFHDTWDLDGTDFTPEASPDDEGYWDDFENIVLNGNYEELGSELLSQPVDLQTDFTAVNGASFTDANTLVTTGGSIEGFTKSSFLTVGKTYKLIIAGTTTSSGFTLGNTTASGNEYGSGFGTHYFTASGNTAFWLRQGSAGTTNITSFSIKQVDPNNRWSLGTGWSISDGKARYDASSGSSFTFLGQGSLFPGAGDYQVTFTLGDLGAEFAYNHAGIVVNGIVNSFQGFGISSAGTHTVSINLNGLNLNLNFYGHTSGGDFSIDDVQIKEYAITPLDV
tara:strand:+ start:183 stop:1148 length:966 start_codon:yes stop_codon:yes gene_type:complete